MSSTILYKFRSGTTFEALPLPGSAARLFDVKKGIVLAKKLDQGSLEFDLKICDATTNQEYVDESMLLPRGTRIVVQRLPAGKGQGFLARMARNQYGGVPPLSNASGGPGGYGGAPATGVVPSNFYTIESRPHDDDEEFVSSSSVRNDEDKELAALRAATETANSAARGMRAAPGGGAVGGGPGGGYRGPTSGGASSHVPAGGPFRPGGGGGGPGGMNFQSRQKPNADPELREQEKQLLPKKRATGIPRTFLSLKNPANMDGNKEGEGSSNVPLLQPNTIGFEELVQRGGGKSESASGMKKDLDYALKLTATTIPEYLQCALCHGVVRDAMILPWDSEGRTTCEPCIRDVLTQNGFRCPLTGMEGVSPDDLLPNHALRKAVDQFVKGVMEKMEGIEKQRIDEDGAPDEGGEPGSGSKGTSLLEGDTSDKGVIVSRRTTVAEKKKKMEESDPFGGDDDFGGDVFAVEAEKQDEEEENVPDDEKKDAADSDDKKEEMTPEEPETTTEAEANEEPPAEDHNSKEVDPSDFRSPEKQNGSDDNFNKPSQERSYDGPRSSRSLSPAADRSAGGDSTQQRQNVANRRRGPPVGYAMGPAGGAAVSTVPAGRTATTGRGFSPRGAGRYDGNFQGRGRGRNFGGGNGYSRGNDMGTYNRGFNDPRQQQQQYDHGNLQSDQGDATSTGAPSHDDYSLDGNDRGVKRPRSTSVDRPVLDYAEDNGSYNNPRPNDHFGRGDFGNSAGRGYRGGGGQQVWDNSGRGRGRFPRGGGGFRGGFGRGQPDDRGGPGRGPFRGGGGMRGGFRGGRGPF